MARFTTRSSARNRISSGLPTEALPLSIAGIISRCEVKASNSGCPQSRHTRLVMCGSFSSAQVSAQRLAQLGSVSLANIHSPPRVPHPRPGSVAHAPGRLNTIMLLAECSRSERVAGRAAACENRRARECLRRLDARKLRSAWRTSAATRARAGWNRLRGAERRARRAARKRAPAHARQVDEALERSR